MPDEPVAAPRAAGSTAVRGPTLREAPDPPSVATARLVERIEAESAFAQHRCAPDEFAERLGLRSARVGASTLVLTRKSESVTYNRWIACGTAGAATEEQLDRVIGLAGSHGCRVVGVCLGPAQRPDEMATWLVARGFERKGPSAKLWRSDAARSADAVPTGITVRRVTRADAGLWVDLVSTIWRAYGSRRAWFEARATAPGWHHHLAWVDGEPVGAGALYVGTAGSARLGHLVDGVTLPEWRKRGVQAALIRKRVRTARRMGCSLMTSETAPPLPGMPLVSFRNLMRQGFRFAYVRERWVLAL